MRMAYFYNFAPGNAGVIFYSDILVPIIGFTLLWLRYRRGTEAAGSTPSAHRVPAGRS
jgi:hypothetical protein